MFTAAQRLAWTLGWLLQLAAASVILAWVIGRVVSDRYGWSQWLLWIPTPALLPVILLGLIAALRPPWHSGQWRQALRRRVTCWMVVALGLTAWFGLFEHRLLRPASSDPTPAASLELVHWNGFIDPRHASDDDLAAIAARRPDIVILTDSWMLRWRQAGQSWMGDDHVIAYTHPFAVISRYPLLECRSIIAKDDIDVVLMRFDTEAVIGQMLTVYAVDLPSELDQSRHEIAAEYRRLLDTLEIPVADLVVGDFNMTRGGAALREVAGDLDHAYDLSGSGYGATFPREHPLYHIDHVLAAPTIEVARYELFDPGISRHRAQSVTLTAGRPRE